MFAAVAVSLALQAPPTQSTDTVARRVLADRDGFQAVRVTFAPGAAVTPGPQPYDVVLVPIEAGLSVEVDGKPVAWRPGVAILIPRGAPHRASNPLRTPGTFISVRRLADADVKPPPAPQSTAVTIVRSQDSKYVRATTLRLERDGELRGPGDRAMGPSVFVLTADADLLMTTASTVREPGRKTAGTVWLFQPGAAFALKNTGGTPIEIVRISAPPSP